MDPQRQRLVDWIAGHEPWLMRRILHYAATFGFTPYTSTLEEAWRMSIAGLSAALCGALADEGASLELGAEDSFTADPMAAFGVLEARRHRERGITLPLFLSLMKYYRQSYLDLVAEAAEWPLQEREEAAYLIGRFFDRVEIAFCVEWAKAAGEGSQVNELQAANRRITNEKNRYLTAFESLGPPALLLDEAGSLVNMNHAAARLLDACTTPGAIYYGARPALPDWLAGEISALSVTGQAQHRVSRTLVVGGEARQFEVTLARMLDVSGKFGGILITFDDVTERERAAETQRALTEFQRSLIDAIPVPLFYRDPQGRLMGCNEAFEGLMGRRLEDMLGTTVYAIASQDVADIAQHCDEILLAQPGKRVYDQRLIIGGNERHLIIHKATFRDARGQVAGIIGTALDITDRQHAAEALERERALLRTVMDNLPDAVYIKDRESRFLTTNAAHLRAIGRPLDQIIGQTDLDLFPSEYAQQYYADEQEIIRTGQPLIDKEESVLSQRRGLITVLVTKVPFYASDGSIAGIVGISRDITERKRAEDAIRELAAFQQTLIDAIPLPVFYKDRDGRFTGMNRAYAQFVGHERDELIGRTVYDVVPRGLAELFEAKDQELLHQSGVQIYENDLRRDGQETRRIVNHKATFCDAQGQVAGIIGALIDITERKRAEEELKHSLSLLQATLESTTDGIIVISSEGRITLYNQRFARLWHVTEEKLATLDDLGLLRLVQGQLRDPETFMAGVHALYADPEAESFDVLEFCDGRVLERYSAPQRVDGAVVGRVWSFRDITERRQAEEQLRRSAEELAQSNEEVKNFAYIVSHDLRAPLVNLKGFNVELRSAIETIHTELEPILPTLDEARRKRLLLALREEVPEALGFIDWSVTRMDDFLRAVLKLSRLGRRELVMEELDVEAMVWEAVASLAHQIDAARAQIHIAHLPPVTADRTAMEQIIGNLLSNAVKYLDPARPGRIDILGARGGDETVFHVQDNGRGIAEEDLPKIFMPFRRVGKQDTPGEGIGLTYVQTLVRRHGGRITCNSTLGVGTTFTFSIAHPKEEDDSV